MIQSLHNQIFNLHIGFSLLWEKNIDYLPGYRRDTKTLTLLACNTCLDMVEGESHWKKFLLDFYMHTSIWCRRNMQGK